MGYRSRWHAARLRITAFHERLDEAEQLARERLGGALPYAVEKRLAALEPELTSLESRRESSSDVGLLTSELEAMLVDLAALASGERDARRVDEAFVDWVKGLTRRRASRPRADRRAHTLTGILRRLDTDAHVNTSDGSALEARFTAHDCPLYFLGELGTEVDALLATPVPRQAGQLSLRPYRWWRVLKGLAPATLGHDELDGRFSLTSSQPDDDTPNVFARAHGDELCAALAALCHFDEPTLVVEGAAATLTWSYDVAYEPLAAATRVLAALRKVLSPPPAPPPRKPRSRPVPLMMPVVPRRLRQRRR